MHLRPILISCPGIACLTAVGRGGDWPQFRGPNGSATSAEKYLPVAWDADKNIAWKAKLPGYAWSSPIIWGDKVFVTTTVTDKRGAPCSCAPSISYTVSKTSSTCPGERP